MNKWGVEGERGEKENIGERRSEIYICTYKGGVRVGINSHELGWVRALHAHDFVVAGAVVERVGALRKVVHDVIAIQRGDPHAVVPRQRQ